MTQTKITKQRIQWIDYLESIAIFMVIIYHGSLFSYNFNTDSLNYLHYFFCTILSTCVPLFFFANGYLLFSKKVSLRKHFSKILRLIVLTIIWSAITVLILMFINQKFFGVKEFLQTVWYRKIQWNEHFWFIGSLVVAYIFFPLLKNAFDTNRKIFFYFTIIITFLTIGNTLFNHIVDIGKFLTNTPIDINYKNYLNMFNPFYNIRGWTLVYFCLGGVVYHFKDKIIKIPQKTRNLISIIGIPISCIGLFSIGLVLSINSHQSWPWDAVFNGYDSIFTLLNVIFIYLLCLNWKASKKLITLISRNTLGIYFIHLILIRLTKPYVQQATWLCNLPCSLIYACIILLLSLGISLMIQKIPIVKKIL